MLQEKLKILRKNAKKTQQQIADYLSITQVAYFKYENGQSEPDNAALVKLAKYYNVTVDYLLGRSEKKEPMCEHMSFDDFSKIMSENGVTEDKIKNLSDEQMKLIAMTINNFNNNK